MYIQEIETWVKDLDFTKITLVWMHLPSVFSEKLPAAGNLAFIFRGQWHQMKWTRFSPTDSEGTCKYSVAV